MQQRKKKQKNNKKKDHLQHSSVPFIHSHSSTQLQNSLLALKEYPPSASDENGSSLIYLGQFFFQMGHQFFASAIV